MRSSRYSTCAIVLAAVLAMPAFAQGSGTSTGTTVATGPAADTMIRRDDNRGFNWGWLGLLGVAGLIGLRRQPDVHRTDNTHKSPVR